MAAFGVKTTLVVRSQVLKQMDRDIIELLEKTMRHLGVTLLVQSPHKKVTKNKDGSLTLHLDVKEGEVSTVTADKVLIALGRPPNVAGLGVDKTAIATKNNSISVDEF